MYRKYGKHLLDFILSLIAFLILSPFFCIITAFLFFNNNGKPFFTQLRPGKKGKLFKLIKFKTMSDKQDKDGKLLPDVARLTSIGKFIRKTSLDELPQLINVIKGDMSLIGPRPLLAEYLQLYNSMQKRRHDVRPGITGWAQVNGRNAISWKKKFELDVWYVDHTSLGLDLKILFMTLYKVVKREGITFEGQSTTINFKGNETPDN